MGSFQWPVRVYYEDTDSGGVVYYANYLKFFERARTEMLRSKGLEQDFLRSKHNIMFAVADVHIQYHRPARFNDALVVVSDVVQLKKAGMSFHQVIYLQSNLETPLCTADVKIACIDEASFRPTRIPEVVLQEVKDE
ncbi:MAG: tol-pal system-associated acyl-CoA thioesterase [Methylococcales bacterium]|nr:tol-pal system-associated acyl-CoA thioesterase [Methylococcales bacterium]MBT7444211.1 tol-pal system-associated acyl-CoA thioesterase [Methylococcales bacterium]